MSLLEFKGKYCDLIINFGCKSIKVHKIIVCENSPLVSRLLGSDDNWPPINSIMIELPDNISEETFENAIEYLYTKKGNDNPIDLIKGLVYLQIDFKSILSLVKKSLPIKTKLEQFQIDILLYIFNLNLENSLLNPLLSFYGNELSLPISKAAERTFIFGTEDENRLIEIYKKKKENKFNRLPEYIAAKEKKWFHFSSFLPDKSQKIEAFGVKWQINRFLYSFGYQDNEDLVKLYVDESYIDPDPAPETHLNIRVNFIIYSMERTPKVEIIQERKVIPNKYKSSYMKSNYGTNTLGFSMPQFKEKRIRISLLMELL